MTDRMKINSIKIEVKPFEKSMKKTIEAVKKLERGKKVRLNKIVFNDIDTLRRIFTKKRIKVLHCIKYEKPNSIYELANNLKRDWKLVSNDVELLSGFGLIKLEKEKEHRKTIKPIVNFSRMNIGVMI